MATPSIAQLFDLAGKVALVTGGARGIGAAIAGRLAEAGAAVAIADVSREKGEATAQQLSASGARVHFIQADLSAAEAAPRCVSDAVQALGRLDVLVNNAGIFPLAPVAAIDAEQWDRVHAVNLRAPFFLAQAAAAAMSAQGGGSIVNIASVEGVHPSGSLAHYDASKGGVIMLTRALALELAKLNVRVNSVSPGGIKTPGLAQAALGSAPPGVPMEAMRNAFVQRVPLGRMGEPDEIARAVLFLATQASSYVTGANLLVDGGYLLG